MNVTAAVTTFGRDWKTVKRALESILSQTVPAMEILLVDDNPAGSPFTEGILLGLRDLPGVTYLTRGGNFGVSEARNLALQKANGEWIAFLDDDDRWLPDKLEKQLRETEAHPDAALIYGGGQILDDAGKDLGLTWQTTVFRGTLSFRDMLENDFVGSTSQPLIKTEAALSAGGFRKMPALEDYELWIRIAEKSAFYGIPEVVFLKHMEEGTHRSANNKNLFLGYRMIYETWKAEYKKDARARKGILRNILRVGVKGLIPAAVPFGFRWAFACVRERLERGKDGKV